MNNVVYNKWAESGRVNWLQKIATKNSPKPDAQYTKIMNTNGVSLIMKSIKTEYKFVSLSSTYICPRTHLALRWP